MKDYIKLIKSQLSKRRFEHCVAVGGFAKKLAEKHGWDPQKAELAGLFHDIAKEWSPQKLIIYVKRHHLRIPQFNQIIKTSPNMLHSYVGAHFAKANGWVRDGECLKAIRSHTLGAVPMGLAQKIIYVADFASPDRTFKRASQIRKIALGNINEGFSTSLEYKIRYQLKKHKAVHPYTIGVWNQVVCKIR